MVATSKIMMEQHDSALRVGPKRQDAAEASSSSEDPLRCVTFGNAHILQKLAFP